VGTERKLPRRYRLKVLKLKWRLSMSEWVYRPTNPNSASHRREGDIEDR
jgi:hypothetical protein